MTLILGGLQGFLIDRNLKKQKRANNNIKFAFRVKRKIQIRICIYN